MLSCHEIVIFIDGNELFLFIAHSEHFLDLVALSLLDNVNIFMAVASPGARQWSSSKAVGHRRAD